MTGTLRPTSEAELASLLAEADGPFELVGTGAKRGLGRPVEAGRTLELSGFAELHVYEPEELIFEAGAGMKLAEVAGLIAARGQQLAFEPPDFSRLLGSAHGGSLGGLLACNLAGPRRIMMGAARDHVLGIRGVSGRGDIFKSGARVVKNVTGYDVPKLMANSWGTLAALTSVTFKVMPRPETEETVVLDGLGDREAVAAMSLAMQSSCEVSGAAHVPGEGTYLRLEGIAASVAYRRDMLARATGRPVRVLAAASSQARWAATRDVTRFADTPDRLVWRLSLTPSEAPDAVARICQRIDARHYYDWAGGLVWLDIPYTDDASAALVRGAIGGGHAMLFRAPPGLRSGVEVFQPQPPALAALTSRVKAALDPRHRLNPGRMYRGL